MHSLSSKHESDILGLRNGEDGHKKKKKKSACIYVSHYLQRTFLSRRKHQILRMLSNWAVNWLWEHAQYPCDLSQTEDSSLLQFSGWLVNFLWQSLEWMCLKNGHLCHLRDFKEVYQHGDNHQEHAVIQIWATQTPFPWENLFKRGTSETCW